MTYEEFFAKVKEKFMDADVSVLRNIWRISSTLQERRKAFFM